MFFKTNKIIFLFFSFYKISAEQSSIDVTLIGAANDRDGVGKVTLCLMDAFCKELKINSIAGENMPKEISEYSNMGIKIPGNIALSTGLLWCKHGDIIEHLPPSYIKIALAMTETTAIPHEWVLILNTYFDAVWVPDLFSKRVFLNYGVNIPIFVLSLPMDLSDYLHVTKKKSKETFVFGISSHIQPRKNQELLIKAFAAEFGNNSKVELLLHSQNQNLPCPGVDVPNIIQNAGTSNISFLYKTLTKEEHISFLSSLNCYVLLSKGEGFSMIPREAMALGIPCILSNNTAHITLCESNYIYGVKSSILETDSYYKEIFGNNYNGFVFNYDFLDVRKALREVYENYEYYEKIALKARSWIANYDICFLKKKYHSFLKPDRVILGDTDEITDDAIITTSKKLYNKYLFITNNGQSI